MLRTGLALVGVLALSVSSALADNGSPYLSGALGLGKAHDVDANSSTFLAPIDLETGSAAQIAVGRHFGEMFRGEIDFSYSKYDADQVAANQAAGDVGSLALGGNFFADFHLPSDITLICPLLSGPESLLFWLTKEFGNGQET